MGACRALSLHIWSHALLSRARHKVSTTLDYEKRYLKLLDGTEQCGDYELSGPLLTIADMSHYFRKFIAQVNPSLRKLVLSDYWGMLQ